MDDQLQKHLKLCHLDHICYIGYMFHPNPYILNFPIYVVNIKRFQINYLPLVSDMLDKGYGQC